MKRHLRVALLSAGLAAVSLPARAQPAASAALPPAGIEGRYAAAGPDRSQLQVLALLPPGTRALDLEITGLAKPNATVESVRPVGELTSHTVFALDGSGSFRGALARESLEIIDAWLGHPSTKVDATHTVQVIVFGDKVRVSEPEASAAAVRAKTNALLEQGAPGSTMLYSGLEEAVQRAAAAPGELRAVWVFTDGGESSKSLTAEDAEKLTLKAGSNRVRVFLATTDARAESVDYITRLRKIVTDTGGLSLSIGDGRAKSPIKDRVGELLLAEGQWSVVAARLCGLEPATDELTVALQHLPTKTSTASFATRRPAWSPAAYKPCCDPAQCSGLRACRGGACEPKACTSDSDCGTSARCEQRLCTDRPAPASASRKWSYWLAGLALLAGIVVLLSRRRAPAERGATPTQSAPPAAAPSPDVPAPPAVPVARGAGAEGPPLQELPETLLVVKAGPAAALGQRFRLGRRTTRVGSNDSNHIRIDIDSVSSEHAEFQLFPSGALFVADLNSTNGVLVDGVRLPRGGRRELRPGAQVSLGKSLRLEVERPGATTHEPAQPAASRMALAADAKKATQFDRN
jgi:hypothetical protein